MGRPPKSTPGERLAKARVAVLNDDIVRLMTDLQSRRGLADKDSREEVREIRSRLLPMIVAVQAHMLAQDIAIDPLWCDLAEKFLDRAEGKAAQSVNLGGEVKHRITTVEVHQPCQ